MNKTILPLASLCVFGAYSIVLGFLCHDSWVTSGRYAPINVNPVGGGSAGKGWGFDGEVHPLSGRFDRALLLGGRDI